MGFTRPVSLCHRTASFSASGLGGRCDRSLSGPRWGAPDSPAFGLSLRASFPTPAQLGGLPAPFWRGSSGRPPPLSPYVDLRTRPAGGVGGDAGNRTHDGIVNTEHVTYQELIA